MRIRRLAVTYDHRLRRIRHPIRSAIHKPQIGSSGLPRVLRRVDGAKGEPRVISA